MSDTEEMSTTETWCCTDCLMLLANGETPPEMNEEETAAWLATVSDAHITLGRATDVCGCDDWDTDEHREGCERLEFSWRACDVCHSHLGGAREAVTFWFPVEATADQGRATITSALFLASVATIGATFVTSWALQAAAMLGGVG